MIVTTIDNKVIKAETLGGSHSCSLCGNDNQLVVDWIQPHISNLGFKIRLKKIGHLIVCLECDKQVKYKNLKPNTKVYLDQQKKVIPISYGIKIKLFLS